MDNKNWGTRQAPYSLNQYSRAGSSITIEKTPVAIADVTVCNDPDVTCINAVFDTGEAEFDCTSTAVNGGWGTPTTSGQCWSSLEACYYFGTPSQDCYDLTDAGQNLPAHVANNSISVSSQCGAPDAKGLCFFENIGAAKIRSNTGDDMFAITNGASGYIEYPALGIIGSDSRLMYIARNGGDPARDVMIPSGPPGTYTDYKSFMSGPPGFMTSEAGCYRLDVDLCQGNITLPPAGPPPLPPVNGVCVAYGATYAAQPASNTATGCTAGTYADAADTATDWGWSCNGQNGGTTANCSASKPVAPCVYTGNPMGSQGPFLITDIGWGPWSTTHPFCPAVVGQPCANPGMLPSPVPLGAWCGECTVVINVTNPTQTALLSNCAP